MIVKNEERTIARCLNSLKDVIDTWVIVDTGSADGTQSVIKDMLQGIPGELHERPWKNFGHNRTEAIRLAEGKADYLLFCDADMSLVVKDPNWKEGLTADAYLVTQTHGDGLGYRNIRLVNGRFTGDRAWRYWGSTHEYCGCVRHDQPVIRANLDGIALLDHGDGGSKADKFSRDAVLLECDLARLDDIKKKHSANPGRVENAIELEECEHLLPRVTFYLAQTYRDMGRLRDSLRMYQRRVDLGGWVEEIWYSLYQIAKLNERLGSTPEVVVAAYMRAYQYRHQRAEPLVDLARIYRERKEYVLAHLFAERAIKTRRPDDILFLDSAIYDWRAIDEFAISSYWVGNYQDSMRACEHLLNNAPLPLDQLARVTENLNFALRALGKNGASVSQAETKSLQTTQDQAVSFTLFAEPHTISEYLARDKFWGSKSTKIGK